MKAETFEELFAQIQIDADNGIIYNKEMYLIEARRISNNYIRKALDKSYLGETLMETTLKKEDIK